MATAFDVLAEEFTNELATVGALLDRAQRFRGPKRAALQLASSTSIVLLLAASFEEYIRQIAKQYCDDLQNRVTSGSQLPPALGRAAWERSVQNLRIMKLDEVWPAPDFAERNLRILSDFCLKRDQTVVVSDLVSLNQHNMRPKEINLIFGRMGLEDYCGVIGRARQFQTFFGVSSGGRARTEFCALLDQFYDVRNTAAHSIGLLRGSGPKDIRRWLEFFKLTAETTRSDMNRR